MASTASGGRRPEGGDTAAMDTLCRSLDEENLRGESTEREDVGTGRNGGGHGQPPDEAREDLSISSNDTSNRVEETPSEASGGRFQRQVAQEDPRRRGSEAVEEQEPRRTSSAVKAEEQLVFDQRDIEILLRSVGLDEGFSSSNGERTEDQEPGGTPFLVKAGEQECGEKGTEILAGRRGEKALVGAGAQVDEADFAPESWYPRLCLDVPILLGCNLERQLASIFGKNGTVSGIGLRATLKLLCRSGEGCLASLRSERLYGGRLAAELVDTQSLLFVGRLPDDTDDAELGTIFRRYGGIERAFVMKDRKGRSKGYGYVEFSRAEDARRAREHMISGDFGLTVEDAFVTDVKDLFSVSLFVLGFSPDIPNVEEHLGETFEKHGSVKDMFVYRHPRHSFAVVDFHTSSDAGKARRAVAGFLGGRTFQSVFFSNPVKRAQYYRTLFRQTDLLSSADMGSAGVGQEQMTFHPRSSDPELLLSREPLMWLNFPACWGCLQTMSPVAVTPLPLSYGGQTHSMGPQGDSYSLHLPPPPPPPFTWQLQAQLQQQQPAYSPVDPRTHALQDQVTRCPLPSDAPSHRAATPPATHQQTALAVRPLQLPDAGAQALPPSPVMSHGRANVSQPAAGVGQTGSSASGEDSPLMCAQQ